MALINCPKCGKQVSDKAAVCPHCNQMLNVQQNIQQYVPLNIPQPASAPAPQSKKSKFPLIVAIIIVVLIGITAAICVPLLLSSGDNSRGNSPVQDASSQYVQQGTVSQDPVQTTTAATEQNEFSVSFTITTVEGIISEYDVDFYVDGTCVDSIGSGMTKQYLMTLTKGSHTIQFRRTKDGKKSATTTLNVSEDTEVTYSLQLRTGFGRDIVISRS